MLAPFVLSGSLPWQVDWPMLPSERWNVALSHTLLAAFALLVEVEHAGTRIRCAVPLLLPARVFSIDDGDRVSELERLKTLKDAPMWLSYDTVRS